MDEQLRWMDATEQADLVRSGQVSAAELLAEARDRIRTLNPALNAVVMELAGSAEAGSPHPAAGEDATTVEGPFPGVPFLVKDLALEIAGTPFSEGSRWLAGNISRHDQELTRRFRRAGLAIIGKTNTCEFGLSPHCEPVLHGATRNPWDLSLSTSGSSGGSAAAVAAGIVPMAHGNDLGGSLRYPAAWCGVFGLKPTRGRVPLGPEYGDVVGGLAAEFALTRTVRDAAALLDAVAGPAPGDPYWAPPRPRPYVAETSTPPGRLRIAATATPNGGQQVHPDYLRTFGATVDLLGKLGHHVEEARPDPLDRAGHRAIRAVYAAAAAWIEGYWTRRLGRGPEPGELEPYTEVLFGRGRKISAGDYLQGMEELQRFSRRVAGFFQTYDLWLTPTVGWPPLPLGTLTGTPEDPLRGEREAGRFLMFDGEYANITGGPAMSVPLGADSAGLPVGMSFLAGFGDEAVLFRLAAQLEQARPWADRRLDAAVP
ncbi:amidase [Arthrobacter oryzae]|uniref:Amidase n=1 Tax=Arthrobacter oryzae TaxID=409290 RepID=A0A495EUS0_9MICC|nr:amidase [Arthrobacter oryzae]RKR20710.1 amidase [Arthrobacter oryzae]